MPVSDSLPEYTVVVATYERAPDLRHLLESLATQTHRPASVVIVDGSPTPASKTVSDEFASRLPLRYERATRLSSAAQRNQGGVEVATPLIAFMDDDAVVAPETCAAICGNFRDDERGQIGGIAARIDGFQHRPPRGLLRRYYRWQAGYDHPTYGGKLFGAAINCLPSYEEVEGGDLIPADWLNSTCTFFRTPLFQRENFPEFEGYSFLEDVHLSARVGRTHQLFFHRTARFEHRDSPSDFKKNLRAMARMRVRHRRIVAREILGLHGLPLFWKLTLHRLFATVTILRRRHRGWLPELLGTWT